MRRRLIFALLGLFFGVAGAAVSWSQRMEAIRAGRDAVQAREEALESLRDAENARAAAVDAQRLADSLRRVANSARLRALDLADKEQKARLEAEDSTEVVLSQREQLRIQTAALALQTANAESARTEAVRNLGVANNAVSRELALISRSQLDSNLTLALLLAVEALDVTVTAEAQEALVVALNHDRWLEAFVYEENRLLGDTSRTLAGFAFSRDGRWLAAGTNSGTVILWNARTHAQLAELGVRNGHRGRTLSVAFSANGELLASSGSDGTILLWDPSEWQQPMRSLLRSLHGHDGAVLDLAFDPTGGSLASGGADNSARIWSTSSGESVRVLRGHRSWVSNVAFSPDGGRLATGSHDGTIRLWEVGSGRRVPASTAEHDSWVWSLAFINNGALAAGTRDGDVIVWDLDPMRKRGGRILRSHNSPVVGIVTSSGRVISAGEDGLVLEWRGRGGEEGSASIDVTMLGTGGRTLELERTYSGALTTSDVLSGRRRVQVWQLAVREGMEVTVDVASGDFDPSVGVIGPDVQDTDVSFEHHHLCDSRLSFIAGPGRYRIYVTTYAGGSPTGQFNLRASILQDPADRSGLPCGRGVAALDPTAIVLGQRSPAETLIGMALTADGRRLATGFQNGRLKVWNFEKEVTPTDLNAQLRLACEIANRDLNGSELRQYVRISGRDTPTCDQWKQTSN